MSRDSQAAVRIERLSKRYRIGAAEERHDTFAASMVATLKNILLGDVSGRDTPQ